MNYGKFEPSLMASFESSMTAIEKGIYKDNVDMRSDIMELCQLFFLAGKGRDR